MVSKCHPLGGLSCPVVPQLATPPTPSLKALTFTRHHRAARGGVTFAIFFFPEGSVCADTWCEARHTLFLWPHTFCKQSCNEGCILMHLSIKDLEHGVERNLFSNMSKAVLQNACVIFKPTLEQTTATVVWRRPRWLHSHGYRDNISPAKHDSYTGFTISDMGH